ncbi:hypothetical protein LZD49_04745 [Dyadobacter sp. CY261]|uniref:hypothetical protein n=1 Tax=Dyadobacter sp. CY261 TaxID=2907203 RepID=UPI001F295420|nr:hypothetical protein [Dyadobacter sp. CY261]MCF0069768.1 hypothetical protein [Dyadobacter sp. CY261]
MMPFPGLTEVKIQWLAIQQGNYKLYGFLIYTGSDLLIVEFLKEGIFDLDVLSGEECAIFLIEPPSKKWINYVKKTGHPWSKFFNNLVNPIPAVADASPSKRAGIPSTSVTIQDIYNSVVILGDGNRVVMNQLLEPDYDALFDRSEAYKVADHFNIAKREIPCLVFFKDIDDHLIWMQQLDDYETPKALTGFFRSFFDSPTFQSLLA